MFYIMTPTHTEYADAAKATYVIGRYPDFGLISPSSSVHHSPDDGPMSPKSG